MIVNQPDIATDRVWYRRVVPTISKRTVNLSHRRTLFTFKPFHFGTLSDACRCFASRGSSVRVRLPPPAFANASAGGPPCKSTELAHGCARNANYARTRARRFVNQWPHAWSRRG